MKRVIMLIVLLMFGMALAEDTQVDKVQAATQQENASPQALDILAASQEFETIGTETYYLASVENSGVDGYVQAAETFDGFTRFVVTMNNTLPDYRYAVVLYEGDCGPDRPEVLRLGDINNTSGDPNTSITETEINFEELTNGNYFMYVFAGEPDTQILACGEVGVGANRMGM
jgi:hypothetical protein